MEKQLHGYQHHSIQTEAALEKKKKSNHWPSQVYPPLQKKLIANQSKTYMIEDPADLLNPDNLIFSGYFQWHYR